MPTTGTERPMSASFQVQHVFFRETPEGHMEDYHRAPRRQIIVVTSGLVEIEISSGERAVFKPGDLLFAEDQTGQGHITRSIRGTRGFVHIVMPPEFDITTWPLGPAPVLVPPRAA